LGPLGLPCNSKGKKRGSPLGRPFLILVSQESLALRQARGLVAALLLRLSFRAFGRRFGRALGAATGRLVLTARGTLGVGRST